MSTFPTDELALALAGDQAAFEEAMANGWPTSLYNLTGALSENVTSRQFNASSSTETIGTGTRTFTLSVPQDWPEGLPVWIADAAAPSTNYMIGTLTADATAGGVITVNVTSVAGSGVKSSWTIASVFAAITSISTPVAIADGGSGATTKRVAAQNLEVAKLWTVAATTEAGANGPSKVSAADSNSILVWDKDVGSGGSATGDFSANYGDIATTSDGGTSWSFETPEAGDMVYDQELKRLYLLAGDKSTLAVDGVVDVSHPHIHSEETTANTAASDVEGNRALIQSYLVDTTSASRTVTLPDPPDVVGFTAAGAATPLTITVVNKTASNDVVISAESGGDINGVASATVTLSGVAYEWAQFTYFPGAGWVQTGAGTP